MQKRSEFPEKGVKALKTGEAKAAFTVVFDSN
jgi:hypothetical protein